MSRRWRGRNPDGFRPATAHEARLSLLSSIIADCVLAVNGGRVAGEAERASCKLFLKSEKAARWIDYLNVSEGVLSFVTEASSAKENGK